MIPEFYVNDTFSVIRLINAKINKCYFNLT